MEEQKKPVIDAEALGAAIGRALVDANPELQEKKKNEERRKKAREALREEVAKANRERLARQMSCDHKKENGKFATNGQVLADGNVLIICTHCAYEWKLKASPENRRAIESGDLTLAEIQPPEIVKETARA